MFWIVSGILVVFLLVVLWLAYSRAAFARWVRAALAREVGLPARADPAHLYYRPFPERLSWNWTALFLGPVWYLAQGLWVHGLILLGLAFVSGGLLIPLVWVYAGLKADEDLREFRIASKSVY